MMRRLATTPKTRNDYDDPAWISHVCAATLWGLIIITSLTFIAAMISARAAAGMAFVLGVGLAAVGSVVGLLFSLPRAIGESTGSTSQSSPERSDSEERSKPLYSLNTNLEQVSDWLTKIIVGVGLVEAQNFAGFLSRTATVLGGEMNQGEPWLDADAATMLALGMLIAFPVLGFLLAFFSVRLYISPAMRAADEGVLRPLSLKQSTKEEVSEAYRTVTSTPPRAPQEPAARTGQIASRAVLDDVLNTPIDRLQDASDLIARGQAALIKGLYKEAADAFERAIKIRGRTPELLLDYARALLNLTPPPWPQIVTILEDARRRFDPTTPSDVRQQVMWELLNAYLYMPWPNGFTAAISVGNEYTNTPEGRDDPYPYVYLAAAHGQAFQYWTQQNRNDLAENEATMARECMAQAIQLGRQQGIGDAILRWLQSLANPKATDNDLAFLADKHPEIFENLGIEIQRPPNKTEGSDGTE